MNEILSRVDLTNEEVAGMLGVSVPTVCRLRKKLGIVRRTAGRKPGKSLPHLHKTVEQNCIMCGVPIHSTRSRVYCSRKCMYESKDYIEKLRSVDRSYMRTPAYAEATRDPDLPEKQKYRYEVGRLTEMNYARDIHVINPEGHPRTLCGVPGGYQLDHKVSIDYGFYNDIAPEDIAKTENLQMLPWKENLSKGKSCA